MKKKKKFITLILIGAVKSVIDMFSGPFLITYFGRIAENPTVSLSIYYILLYFFLAVGSAFVAPLVIRKFKVGLFRLGIVINILYFLIFIFFGDRVIDHVLLVGILSGISAACYWYPLSMIKAEQVSEQEREHFFAWDRISVTVVSILGPVVLGSMISSASYLDTAVIVGIVSVLQLSMTLLIGPVKEEPDKKYELLTAAKTFFKAPELRQVFLTHFLTGFTVSGVALKNVSTLVLCDAGLSDLSVGYATSACSILTIASTLLYNRKLLKRKNTGRFILLCGLLPLLSFGIALLSGNLWIYLAFFIVSGALPVVMHVKHTIHLFEKVGEGGLAQGYRGEYFVVLEFILESGRILGCLVLIPAALSKSTAVMDVVTLLLVLTIPLLSFATNRYDAKRQNTSA